MAWGINILYVYRINSNIDILPRGINHIHRYGPVVQVVPRSPFQDPVRYHGVLWF